MTDDLPHPSDLKDVAIDKEITKQFYREKVWDQLVENKVYKFPKPYGRIPNFKGAEEAAAKLLELEEFRLSKSVEINPDKPLQPARVLALKHEKDLFVPVPRLQESLLKKLRIQEGLDINRIVSRWGIDNTGQKIDIDDKIHIDLIVMGCVAVTKEGFRIGKGKGYADLEYAILKEMKAVDDNTVIVTTVHDIQVYDILPKEIFKKHDVPVDFILTPTQIIKIEKRLPRPEGIYWELLSQKQINSIQVLKKLRNTNKNTQESPLAAAEGKSEKRYSRQRINKNSKTLKTEEANVNSEVTLVENNENIPPKKSKQKHRHYRTDFSLMVKNIERNVRVRDLKNALLEKGIKPYNITWKGHRGYCYLHYGTKTKEKDDTEGPFAIDNVIEIVQELKITPESKKKLVVKVMEPITRIETTDVTAV